jgi:hypothetical protein
LLAVALLCSLGCATQGARSPERLRDDYVRSLQGDDARAAYAMLSPELRAETSFEDFDARWKANAAERKDMAAEGKGLSKPLREPIRSGTTVHEGGRVVRWTDVGGRYYVVDGLPGTPQTATPGQTIRALIVAVRATDLSSIRILLGEDLATAIDEDWSARVDAMEAALDRPGSIELSSDLRRAELSYEPGRVLTLEQTPRGWRITSLE